MKLISKFHSTKAIQNLSLLSGLGLLTPSVEFWEPVGINTANMVLEDKINLLAYLVPRFGSGNAHQEAALTAFATGLEPTMSVVRKKCPDLSASDVELLGTELLCAEILIPGRSSKEEFAAWLGSLNDADLKAILASRKSSNDRYCGCRFHLHFSQFQWQSMEPTQYAAPTTIFGPRTRDQSFCKGKHL